MDKKIGDFVMQHPGRNMDAMGHITVFGEDRIQMMSCLQNALSSIKIQVI